MPEMTENQTPLRITHRKKNRESHNAVERHRKKKINSGINKIGELIPCSPALKQSKNMILDQAYKYISELKRQNDEILLNGGTKEQGEEIVRLRNQLDNLRNENDRFLELLKANDICLHDDPTIHWKRKFKGSKVAMMISPNQMQDDMLIYTNGNQLNGNCHQTTIQSSPELTLNTLKHTTPETCLDIMMPMADIGPVENGVQLQTGISEQDVPDCLPTAPTSLNTAPCTTTTGIVHSMLNVSTNTSDPDLLQHSHSSCALTPLASPTSTSAPIVLDSPQARFGRSISEAASGCPIPNVPGVSANASLALPVHLQQTGTMCMDVECPSGIAQQTVLGPTPASGQNTELRSMKWPMVECPQSVVMPNVCQNSPTLARGLPQPFNAGAMYNGSVMSSCPVASSWTVSCPVSTNACSSDSSGLGALTCMTFAGNTRTTWTTLQLAGNTVHPVSQVSCGILPTASSENAHARSSFPASEAGPLVNNVAAVSPASSSTLQGTSFCSAYSQLHAQVPVTLQNPVPAVPTAKVVSLLPPLQVIQMAHAPGGSDPSSPNSQKLIILQPANPSSPAVVRGAMSGQAQGQQIVIIQAAGQNGVSVVPPHASRAAPALDSSAGPCSSGAGVHSVGGKHLVHILPRPVSCGSSSSSSSQSPAVAAAGPQPQQPKTISVNGQIFAVQPVKQGGSSMHIIQPTTSADPHTNVALNTFGALSSLSQSVSQMAGPLTLSPSASSAQTVCTAAAATASSPFTNNLASSNPLPPKCARAAHRPSKCKKSQRKLLSAKHGLSKRARASRHKPRAAGDHAGCDPGSGPPESAAVERALPASPHLSLPHNAATVAPAAATPEHTAAALPTPAAPAPSVAQAAAPHPEETRVPPASLAASSPRVDPLKDDVCAVTEPTAPVVPSSPCCPAGEAGAGKESGLGRCQAGAPTPHGIPGITSVSQQLESLAAAQRDGRVESSEETGSREGKASSREQAPSAGKQRAESGLPSGEPEGASQPHPPCPPEPSAQRQTESPMSTSSGSSRGFSVASLLPDSAREDGAFNSYGLPDHGDIVSLAARAIFEQESPGKGGSPDLVGYEAGAKLPCAEKAPCPSLQPDKGPGVETNAVPSQGPAGMASVAKETPSVSLACAPLASPVAMNQGHGGPTARTQLPGDLPSAPPVYPEQAAPLAEYPAKVHPQSPLAQESRLKQSVEMRKDASKRTGPPDHLVSTAKRQKQCQGVGKPGLSALAGHLCDRDPPFMAQMPAGSPNHNLGALFPSANFLGASPEETLRTVEAHCTGPPRVLDPAAQQLQPHGLLQANGSSASGLPLAHTHSYYKHHHHQSQARDRHLYQLQHHHYSSHGEGSAPGQAHGAQHQHQHQHQHQLRVAPHDAQMQKKRGLVRAAPGSQLSIQPKQQQQQQQQAGGGQGRHKGSQQPLLQQQQQHGPHTHFSNAHPDKRCENSAGGRSHHLQSLHAPDLLHPDSGRSGQGPGIFPEQVGGQSRIQRLLTSRTLEQQMASKARPSDKQCPPHRQERNRISSYSAEALIGRPSSAESRLAMQSPRAALEQSELRTYLDLSMNKSLPVHGLPAKLSMDHCMAADVQSLGDCQPFKATQAVGNFEVQPSRGSEMVAHRGIQAHGFRLAQGAGAERPARLPYLPMQGISTAGGASLRDGDGSCHQSFLQSLLPPPLAEQLGGGPGPGPGPGPEHGRNSQCALPVSIEYTCAPARETAHGRRDGEGQSCDLGLGGLGSRGLPYPDPSSVPDIQSRNSSPSVAAQKASLRLAESQGNKCHANAQVSSNMHGGVRPHPLQPGSPVGQRVRHQAQGGSAGKQRPRSGSHRGGAEALERSLQLPLPSGGGMMLGRQQPSASRAASIVRFVADSQQVPSDNLTPDQHSMSQTFGFPFIAEGGMNPPLNANPPFIPPVTQPGANRTPTLIPVEPQNPLPSFYPPYSPAHPNLSNDLSLPYFSNQIFTSPNTEKAGNPFGSILSPPRPVGFPQPSFPLLPDISARPIANSSSITAHLSNFNLTTLFPEIAAAPLAADTPAMPMSPLLPLTNPALSDVSKQHSNRSAHNISHILGHDGSSAV